MEHDIESARMTSESDESFSKLESGINLDSPYGNYIRCFRYKSSYIINLGPHFFIQVIIMILTTSFGTTLVYFSKNRIPNWCWYIYTGLYTIKLAANILMLVSDPGIISNNRKIEDENLENRHNVKFCKKCGVVDHSTYHCEDCDVCIREYDHHCGVIGKCIGGGNLVIFYVFVGSLPIFLWASIFIGIMVTQSEVNIHK